MQRMKNRAKEKKIILKDQFNFHYAYVSSRARMCLISQRISNVKYIILLCYNTEPDELHL